MVSNELKILAELSLGQVGENRNTFAQQGHFNTTQINNKTASNYKINNVVTSDHFSKQN